MTDAKAANLAALRARLWAARGDLPALKALNDELSELAGPTASALQREVKALIKASSFPPILHAQRPTGGTPPFPSDLVGTIRARAKVPSQPLYRYGVTDQEFAALRGRLDYLHLRGGLEQANDRSAAAFVLYCAEWFRREYDGGGYSWDAPYPAGLSHQGRKNLATQGLDWWGRKPRQSAHGELRLMSLALEGGFPTRLLESRENGRIAQHLARLLSQAEAADASSDEGVDAMSRSMGGGLGTYDHPEFHALCAELIVAIMTLKAQARAEAPAGVPPMAWLDGARPEWRDNLPIVLPGERAKRLLDDLVSAQSGRISGDGARATRLLVADEGAWKPAARLHMAGSLDLRQSAFRPADGRIRVLAAGALSGLLAGELGIIDPPTDDTQHWLCRPRGGGDFEVGVGFDVDLELELRAGSTTQSHLWPGGTALRGELLVFADETGDESTTRPKTLALLGQGSVRTRRCRVYCAAPIGYRAELAEDRQPVEPFGHGNGFVLFETSKPVLLLGSDGDAYRVETGADEDSAEHLIADGKMLKGAEAHEGGVQLFLGAPALWMRTGSRLKSLPTAELFWRRPGSPAWRPWGAGIDTYGLVDVAWRDGPSGVLRDRLRFVVLPPDISILTTSLGRFRSRIDLAGPAAWELSIADDRAAVADASPRRLDVEWTAKPQRRLVLDLQGPGVPPIRISVRPRYSAAAFFSRDGDVLGDRMRIMADDLWGAIAFGEGPERLYLQGPADGHARYVFDDETPLWALSEDVARLLSAGRDLDDEVTVEFGRSSNPRLTIGRYSATIELNREGVVLVKTGFAPPGQGQDRRLEWFSILEPNYFEMARGREFARVPPELVGPGMAVLRKGERIIGRPTFVPGTPVPPGADHCELQCACLVSNAAARARAIDAVLDRLAEVGPGAEANHAYLHRLVLALDGLPPSALDPFRRLAGRPAAMAALLTGAPTDELRGAVWKLERDLPFLWCTAPVTTWSAGFDRYAANLTDLLTGKRIEPQMGASIAQVTVRSAAKALADLDPGLRVIMTFCRLVDASQGAPPSIFQAANGRVGQSEFDVHDPRVVALNTDPSRASCFRHGGLADLLPNFSAFLPIHWEGLDAACACALAAAGRATLTDHQLVVARAARAEEPICFNDMYAAALSVLARGGRLECIP
jgi:hypothetical protein